MLFKNLLLQSPKESLLEFLVEKDAKGRSEMMRSWIDRKIDAGVLPCDLSEDVHQTDCILWLEENLRGLLWKLLEELDDLRTYKAADIENLNRAIQHINHSMSQSKFRHH